MTYEPNILLGRPGLVCVRLVINSVAGHVTKLSTRKVIMMTSRVSTTNRIPAHQTPARAPNITVNIPTQVIPRSPLSPLLLRRHFLELGVHSDSESEKNTPRKRVTRVEKSSRPQSRALRRVVGELEEESSFNGMATRLRRRKQNDNSEDLLKRSKIVERVNRNWSEKVTISSSEKGKKVANKQGIKRKLRDEADYYCEMEPCDLSEASESFYDSHNEDSTDDLRSHKTTPSIKKIRHSNAASESCESFELKLSLSSCDYSKSSIPLNSCIANFQSSKDSKESKPGFSNAKTQSLESPRQGSTLTSIPIGSRKILRKCKAKRNDNWKLWRFWWVFGCCPRKLHEWCICLWLVCLFMMVIWLHFFSVLRPFRNLIFIGEVKRAAN